ncbi:MAG: glycosyltransferase family 2 protein [Desulfobacterales bacterium]|nr:glycosyltransferase family 2 protein [Desulfobacterales bacterium]MDD4072502.1 glycosyltransferase family 2 protein [Desulfobacterales bacterium]MDD4391138.1 glycosyltransferase family 2 protein [Desulfobacterales bacterium]
MPNIAVLIPCYNEEHTIRKVIRDFRKELPNATIYVYDNNCNDTTAQKAEDENAIVRYEKKQGKGNVVRTMFRDIEADFYVMVDGDCTYPAEKVHDLLKHVISGEADMTVGARLDEFSDKSFRPFHKIGNEAIKWTINFLFDCRLRDILSGYRCFNRKFVKSIPVLSQGFEVETELTLQALDKNMVIKEVQIPYRERPEGSYSKLSTFRDGIRIIKTILSIFKDYMPLKCFSFIGLMTFLMGLGFGSIPIYEFIRTAKVTHPSTAVLATGIVLISLLSFITGLILESSKRRHKELFQIIIDHKISHVNELHMDYTERLYHQNLLDRTG